MTFRLLLLCTLLTACGHPKTHIIEPTICYSFPERCLKKLPSPFLPLKSEERESDWGRELLVGDKFAQEMDLYRAITAYKRALFLLPPNEEERRNQINYDIMLSYYLGNQHQAVVETFEGSELIEVTNTFPPFSNLLLMLYDSYQKLGWCEKADNVLSWIEKYSEETGDDLRLGNRILRGEGALDIAGFCDCALSTRTAQALNAILPGAGYFYVGQPQSGFTSFIINALFIIATYQFFDRGYPAAGAITLSLETGWYFGGINGAGLAAKEYNEHIYNQKGKDTMLEQRLFPILMFDYAF